MDDGFTILYGRPYEGIGILIRKSLSKDIKLVYSDNCRFIRRDVSRNSDKYLFINATMLFQCEDNYNT